MLKLMKKQPKLWFTQCQILTKTGCTQQSVSWALLFLRSLNHIECTPDAARNSRYLRYRIAQTK